MFIAAAAPEFKEKDKALIEWYKRQLGKLPIDVKLNHEVKSLSEISADEIVIATGASARKLKVHGGENAIDAIDFLLGNKDVGENVAVIGGGLTGCEIAYQLALDGKKPFIVEMLDDLIKVVGVNAANSTMLRDLLAYHRIPVYLEAQLKEIHKSGVVIVTKDGEKKVPADSVIASIGYNAGAPLVTDKTKNVHVIGDAERVASLKKVIWEANDLVLQFS